MKDVVASPQGSPLNNSYLSLFQSETWPLLRGSALFTNTLKLRKSLYSCKLMWTVCTNWRLPQCAIRIKSLQFTSLTVFESSLPDSMILKHKGIISVVRRKFMTSASSVCKAITHQSACNSREGNNE